MFSKKKVAYKNSDSPHFHLSKEGDRPTTLMPKFSTRILTYILLGFVFLYFALPLWWLIVSATKNNEQLINSFGLWFDQINLQYNWDKLQAWSHGQFPRWVLNSLLYSTTAGVIGTLLSISAGYSLAKFEYPGKKILLAFIMSGLLMPVALLTIPLYMMAHYAGLTNTIWAIIIPSCVSPFGVFLGHVYASTSVPSELIEAARIDGAGELRIFFTMVLRLLAPAMVTIFLFIFVATWNNFLLPLMMLSDTSLTPVTLGLYGMGTYFKPENGAVLLGSLLGVIPLILLFLGLQKYWQSGLAAGSVKG